MLVLFLLQACAAPCDGAGPLRLESSMEAMGSTFSLVLYGDDRNRLEAASSDAFGEARRLDMLLSNYKTDSEWSKVNRDAAKHPVPVSKELYELLADCNNYSRRSEGTFDITVGSLMQVWGFYQDTGHLAKPEEVGKALQRTGYRNIVLNSGENTVYFAKAGLNLDPGGVGKGYAVDKMVEVLKKDGIRAALVSGGGSSIYGLGAPPGETGWPVQIKDPANESGHVAEVTLRDESLSTSGSYEKFFVAEGKTWSHIMDPRTGYPAQGTLSVSVVAPRTLDSEVWAKPYFIQGRRWTAAHKPKEFRVFFCEDQRIPPEKQDKVNQSCAWLP